MACEKGQLSGTTTNTTQALELKGCCGSRVTITIQFDSNCGGGVPAHQASLRPQPDDPPPNPNDPAGPWNPEIPNPFTRVTKVGKAAFPLHITNFDPGDQADWDTLYNVSDNTDLGSSGTIKESMYIFQTAKSGKNYQGFGISILKKFDVGKSTFVSLGNQFASAPLQEYSGEQLIPDVTLEQDGPAIKVSGNILDLTGNAYSGDDGFLICMPLEPDDRSAFVDYTKQGAVLTVQGNDGKILEGHIEFPASQGQYAFFMVKNNGTGSPDQFDETGGFFEVISRTTIKHQP